MNTTLRTAGLGRSGSDAIHLIAETRSSNPSMVCAGSVPSATMDAVNPMRPRRPGAQRRLLRALPGSEQQTAPTSPTSDLMSRAATGDRSAFAALYDELAPTVHGLTTRIVRDPAMAEEVTQEVFVEMWRLAPRYDASRGSVRSWAAAIAHNRAVDRVRSEQAHRDRDQRVASQQPVTTPAADEAVHDRADHQRVREALSRLTATQREAVEMAYYGGHTYREVASLLDVAEGTVKTRIRDGLIRLRSELAEAGGER